MGSLVKLVGGCTLVGEESSGLRLWSPLQVRQASIGVGYALVAHWAPHSAKGVADVSANLWLVTP